MPEPVVRFVLTGHARFEMARRGIDEEVVRRVLAAPESRQAVRTGRDLFQAKLAFGEKLYLVRVFVDVDRNPAEVVTVYRTSKLEKYSRDEP